MILRDFKSKLFMVKTFDKLINVDLNLMNGLNMVIKWFKFSF